ncbi:hypothetical protein J2W97_003600 [Paenibacillus jamilae]|nr:hypothetical protein [Paenibacillus jamilae]
MKIALHKKLACLIVLGGILTVVATGFGGDKEPYKLPDKPKEAAVSTFSEYMNASMSVTTIRCFHCLMITALKQSGHGLIF